jgi:hypothetical protein
MGKWTAPLSGGEREILGGGPQYSSRGKREADERKGCCQHTIAGKIPEIESGG